MEPRPKRRPTLLFLDTICVCVCVQVHCVYKKLGCQMTRCQLKHSQLLHNCEKLHLKSFAIDG